MADPTPPSFPNIKSKLGAPTKKSAFEKAKAEAEAKRLREEAETAAVYEDFIKSFSNDETPSTSSGGAGGGGARRSHLSGPPGRGGSGGFGGRGGGASGALSGGPPGVGGLRPPPPSGLGGAGQRRHFTAPSAGNKDSPAGGAGPGAIGVGKIGGFSLGSSGGKGGGTFDGSYSGRKRNLDSYMDEQSGGAHLSEREKARRLRESTSGILKFENSGLQQSIAGSTETVAKKEDYFPQEDEDEDSDSREEKEQPKPTVSLVNLPPTFSKEDVRSLFRDTNPNMVVDSIRMIPAVPQGPSSASSSANTPTNMPVRKGGSAIVTLSTETPSSEIDALTSTLQNKYLGYGFWLSISRQLASTALSINQPFPTLLATGPSRGGNQSSYPFGAKSLAAKTDGRPGGHSRAPPPSSFHHPRGFAPPSSLGGSGGRTSIGPHNSNNLQVLVYPPTSLRTLKLIHKTLEHVFTYGPEFEALLMSMPQVQKDERWSFLFDTRSEGHTYYRWRLWEVLSGAVAADARGYAELVRKGVEMFEGANMPLWLPPRKGLQYEWAGDLEEIVADPEYRSEGDYSGSDSESEDHHQGGWGRKDRGDSGGPLPLGGLGLDSSSSGKDVKSYLGPLKRGKLMWLVSRVPTSTTKVRRGDVARVMAFAIENAAAAEEVVEVLVGNVVRPLAFQEQLIKRNNEKDEDASQLQQRERNTDDNLTSTSSTANTTQSHTPAPSLTTAPPPSDDLISGAKIVALYLISDVLSNSSLGIRNAWRYRTLVEQKLREAKVMESLGRTYRSESWGRIRKEKFRRLVVAVLGLWESWNVFPQGTHEEFMRGFMEGGKGEGEKGEKKEKKGKKEQPGEAVEKAGESVAKTKSRWKTVDTTAEAVVKSDTLLSASQLGEESMAEGEEEDIDGAPMVEDDEDVDGVPMEEEEDIDGVPIQEDDEDVDGVPMVDDDEETQSPPQRGLGNASVQESSIKNNNEQTAAGGPPPGFGRMTFGVRAVGLAPGPAVKRKRPKAEDMFADDDDEE